MKVLYTIAVAAVATLTIWLFAQSITGPTFPDGYGVRDYQETECFGHKSTNGEFGSRFAEYWYKCSATIHYKDGGTFEIPAGSTLQVDVQGNITGYSIR